MGNFLRVWRLYLLVGHRGPEPFLGVRAERRETARESSRIPSVGVHLGGGMLSEEFALMVGKEDFCPGK